jgi:hypothetical protein
MALSEEHRFTSSVRSIFFAKHRVAVTVITGELLRAAILLHRGFGLFATFKMRQRFFHMLRRADGILLMTLVDGYFEVRDAFLNVQIGLFFLSGFGVGKRSLSVHYDHISVTSLAGLNCFFRMLDGFHQMIFREGDTRRKQESHA